MHLKLLFLVFNQLAQAVNLSSRIFALVLSGGKFIFEILNSALHVSAPGLQLRIISQLHFLDILLGIALCFVQDPNKLLFFKC